MAPIDTTLSTAGTGTNGQGQSVSDANAPGKTYGTPAPTVADLYGGNGSLTDQANNADVAKTASYDPATIAANETKTRSDVLSSYQTQVDALDQAAAAARARITTAFAPVAAGRVGGATAIEARRGLLGSDFGQAQTDTVNQQNNTDLGNQLAASDQMFSNQRADLIKFIAGEADKEIALRTDASQKGADAKISEIQNRTDRAKTSAQASAKAMIAAGVTDPSNPNYSDSITKIASTTGLTKDEVTGIFNDTKNSTDAAKAATAKAQAEALSAGRITVSPGQKVYDVNGKVIAEVQPTDKFASQTLTDDLGNQRMVLYDTTTGKIVGYGNSGTTGSPSGGLNGTTLPSAPKATTADTLFGANSQYASGTVQDALSKLGVSPDAAGTAGVDPMAKVSDLPKDQQDRLSSAIDAAGGTKQGNPNAPFAQYGLLSKTDYNPKDTTDQLANLYLDKYIKSGAVPTASTMGRNIKPGLMAAISSRASDLYFKATGNPLPNPNIIKAQQEIIANNYKLGNNLALQEKTVSANVDLNLGNMNKNGLNSSGFRPLDDLIDNVKGALQDPNVGQFVAQNSTIQNELGSLLAVKNAGGTTVYDKLTSAGIIQSGDSPDVIKQKVTALIQEAGNFAKALTDVNGTAYSFTDPLLQDSNNPARTSYLNPKSSASPQGTSGPITAPDGVQVIITD